MAKQPIDIGAAPNDGSGDTLRSAFIKTNENFDELYLKHFDTVVVVKSVSDLASIDSTKVYLLDGELDLGSTTIEVPVGGMNIAGYGTRISRLTSSENSYTMFTSPVGGSGDLFIQGIDLVVTGTGSKVFDLTDVDGTHAVELEAVNYTGCTSRGELTDYRQLLESNLGLFGGTPELTLSGTMNGIRSVVAISRGLSNLTALYKEGTSLSITGRFITDFNCDLPATGAFCDFQASNFTTDESFEIKDARFTRSGLIDATDTGIISNITADSVKSKWNNTVGLKNTVKYLESRCTAEVLTSIVAANTYYPLAGTFTLNSGVHFDMPANGEFRALTGQATYKIQAELEIVGTSTEEIDIKITKSTDDGSTWPTEVNHIRRQINNFVGSRDVAFFPINFIVDLNEGDRVRFEVENATTPASTNDVTLGLDSFIIISGS